MSGTRVFLIAVVSLALLSGCTAHTNNNSSNLLQDSTENIRSSQEVESWINEAETPSEQFMMDLRETLNLSFKIFDAMENNQYSFLESTKAKEITIDKENNQIVYKYYGEEIRSDFLKGLNFSNLEYWGSGYNEDGSGFQIVFANYFQDTHGTIYFEFIREGDHWLFNGFTTNA
ncbi:hypothetical protein [Paenibacillus antibioticophila]|uniref:hypothetical protein n=1 Tax=Paenibacillus antibioticophila TaxID=1274374 RepID=UPI0005CB481E|nr:hypothetical protein [Paenibacillus antibioticophila]